MSANNQDFNLKEIYAENTEELITTIEFEGLEMQVVYADADELRRMFSKCKKIKRIKGKPTEEVNQKKYMKLLAEKILSWKFKGEEFKLKHLSLLSNFSTKKLDPEMVERALSCDADTKAVLFDQITGLAAAIENEYTELHTFKGEQLEAELKNFKTSQE